MALSPTVLAGLLKTNIEALPWVEVGDEPKLQDFCDAIAQAVVTHVTTSATVIGTATGVINGPSTAPVTGTVT